MAEQRSSVIEWVNPETLKPHPKNTEIYGEDGYLDLVDSIKELGVLQAIYARKDNVIISGHRRWRASIEAGQQIPIIRVNYPTETDEVQAIIEHNRYRIKTGLQLYNEGKELEEIEGRRAKEREKMGRENFPYPQELGRTRDKVAEIIGLGSGKQWDKLSFIAENKPELLEQIKPAGITIHKAYKKTKDEVIHEANNQELINRAREYKEGESLLLRCGDFYTDYKEIIQPETIDCIVTDPPWTKESMYTYAQLAEVSSIILKPGASVFAMVGQNFLPEAINLMSKHLNYWWVLSYLLPGEHSREWGKKIIIQNKPILWFVKGKHTGNYIQDTLYSEQRDKRFHAWQSSVEGFRFLIEQATKPNDLIFDPFVGSGSTGAASLISKRRFIGIDINQETIRKAKGFINAYNISGKA